jgi:hypothetical protein
METRKERWKDNFGNCKGTKSQTNNFLAWPKTKFSWYKDLIGETDLQEYLDKM